LNQYKCFCVCITTCIAYHCNMDHDMKLKRIQTACTTLLQTTAITPASLPSQLCFIHSNGLYLQLFSFCASVMHSVLCVVQITCCTQVWRPLRGPVQDSPLAVCDAATTKQADLLATSLHFPDRTGEVYNVMHSPEHR